MIKEFLKHSRLILSVAILLLKYESMRLVLSNRRLSRIISNQNNRLSTNELGESLQLKRQLVRHTDVIINRLYSKASCLTRTLVKRHVLYQNNIKESIIFGTIRVDGDLSMHSWLECEKENRYIKVLTLS